ncbi:protein disulfide oxidoreductase [Methylomagnum ishizawai]|uniref:protein disulfide oxidoreductase n=1 Tax=Methylomagnum ishizawai TaxID=1760988 RepID=UPI001C32C9D0|nr:protein disulfide oxidoreductase [Methylomagnum ishizawai]BBL74790.1 protein disulfide oxidoreductase [Methylomagnum ishizawai]
MNTLNKKFGKNLLAWLALVPLFFGMQLFANRDLASGPPPAIQGPTLDGQAFPGLASLPKPAVLYFWASWCPVCRGMQGGIQELAQDMPLLGIAMQSGDAAEVAQYMKQMGFDIPVVIDASGDIGKAFGLRGVPAVFVLGADGNIRYASAGYTTALGVRLRYWLAGL